MSDPSGELLFEEWGASYGSPYLVAEDQGDEEATLAEPAEPFLREPTQDALTELAFVDGVRRAEGIVYHRGPDGTLARGVVGAHGCGAVLVTADAPPRIQHVRARRMVIMGSGRQADLPSMHGYTWEPHSVAADDPDAPMDDLQDRMRRSEARLAERLSMEGWLTIVDGPLNFVRSLDEPVVGYVKTHLRRRLPPELHVRVPELRTGQRTALFLARQSYSAYVRIGAAPRLASPWSGIVRIEVPESQGLAAAVDRADAVAASLPRFAGVQYKDPRAPQNLLPVGALEQHLRHRLGPADRAARAIRVAVSDRSPIPTPA